jgi:N-acetylglucosaminyldiphosphoundecaprenol N-acetyl-beta-D-mannosaminyltransferase
LKILDLNIEKSGYAAIIHTLASNISLRRFFSFSYVNVHVVLSARKNKLLRNDLNQFSALYADGIGIYSASKFLYGAHGLPERINGTDLYYKVLDLAESRDFSIFFFGGGETAAKLLYAKLKQNYPNLKINGIMPRTLNFTDDLLQIINLSNSDILFLGLGTPDQEKWVASFGKKCNIPIQISVGSGIDFLSGTYKRAPKLFQKIGLEWLFRLFIEPKRLWKRYLIGIPTFLILIIKQKLIK